MLPPLGDAIGALSYQVETATFYFTGRPNLDLPNDVRPRGRMQYLSGLREGKGMLVQGRWPELPADGGYDDSTGNTDGVVIEVAVDSTGFEFLDIPLGEGFGIVPATGGDGQATTQVVLVGVVEPTDPDEEYWYRRQKLLSYHDDDWTLVPMFVSEDALRQQVGRRYPGIYTSSAWFLQVDREGIPAKSVDELQRSLQQVRRNVANYLPNGSTSTGLARILEDHEEQLLLARIPLFLMVFLVTGILAYYLTITAGMVIRARAGGNRHAEKPRRDHGADRHTYPGGRTAAGRASFGRRSAALAPAGERVGRLGVRRPVHRGPGVTVLAGLRHGRGRRSSGGGCVVPGHPGRRQQGHRRVPPGRRQTRPGHHSSTATTWTCWRWPSSPSFGGRSPTGAPC